MDYQTFLESKRVTAPSSGFDPGEISPVLFPFQRDIVRWALRGGRRAIFAAFGLGKSLMQLEIMRQILSREGGKALIICPLGVRQEFMRDAKLLGLAPVFIRRTEEVDADGLYLTNYESVRDGRLDVNLFNAVSLDEASVLRSYGSKTYQTFLETFTEVPYRFVATATPSPNRYKELIHYAGFLGVMDTGQALTRFFQRDSTKANNLTLYPHKEREFWLWLASWAVFVQKPSDLGYSDEGYILPDMEIVWHEIPINWDSEFYEERDGQTRLVRDATLSLPAAAREKRETIVDRIAKAKEIVEASPDDHFILWHDQEAERHEIKRQMPEAVEVYGSLDLDIREERIIGFSEGDFRLLATKPILSGSGCNFQRFCHREIFCGVGFKFNDFIQAIHRVQRFQQTQRVRIDIIYAESEYEVVKALKAKWKQHDELTQRMEEIIKEYGLADAAIADEMKRSIGVERITAEGDGWFVANNDTVQETKGMEANSVDLIVTSIPFSNHYEYTPSYNDFGHTTGDDQFFEQMDYLTPELFRVLKPGRIYACHTKDRINFGNVTGKGIPTVQPFHAEVIEHGLKHGFDYIGMITVITDVVRENNQTYRLGWTEQCKDGSRMGVGSPEYIILFHKPQSDRTKGYADTRITKTKDEYSRARWQTDAHAFWRSSGDRLMTPDELGMTPTADMVKVYREFSLQDVYNYETHVKIGEKLDGEGRLPSTFMALAPGSWHPEVWDDVNRMLTLNTEQSHRRLALHVCLAEGSQVLTKERGYVPIEDVQQGENVLTHKGRWRKVKAKAMTGARRIVELRSQGVNIQLTPDHKLWVRDSRDKSREADYMRKVEPQWMEAANTVGAYVNRKLAPIEENDDHDLVTWWTVGRWLADGHIDKRGCAHISFGDDKFGTTIEMLGRYGVNPPRQTGTAWQLQLKDDGHILRDILEQCGHGALEKHLPSVAYTLPVDKAMVLLQGYLSGDGHFLEERNRWMASSVSKTLLLGIAYLAQRCYGAIASVHKGRPEHDHVIQGRTVHAHQEWALSFDLPDKSRRKKPLLLDDGAWMKVRSVDECGAATTWNLEVEEDNSYTAENVIVKNCPLQFDICDRLITRYSNPGELVYDPFGGLMTVPLRALHLGRRGRGVELNTSYFLDGVKYLEAEEQRKAMPTLFTFEEVAS